MIQLGVALEGQANGGVATLTVGWGLALFANEPWYRQMFAIIAQGAVGVRRFGVVLFGFFITLQLVDIEGARKSIMGAAVQQNNVSTRKISSPGRV